MAAQDYERLFHSAGDDLRRFLSRKVSCPHTVADIMQEAFLRLMGAQPSTDIRDPRAYLFRIAANLAINHVTRGKDTIDPCDVEQASSATASALSEERTPERVVQGNQQLQRVMEAIDGLPSRCKTVFILYRFHTLSQETIAARLGISVSMVEKHVIRAMRCCREARDDHR